MKKIIISYSHWFNALDKTVSEEITQNIKSAVFCRYRYVSLELGRVCI